jgi:putative ATP-dependent endonuclease of OLD family
VRLTRFVIDHYRSIEHVEIRVPEGRPLILFGPNNAGKSNIISAIDRALGERWPLTTEFEDSDYFMRDKDAYPESDIQIDFDETYFTDRYGRQYKSVVLHYESDQSKSQFRDISGNRLYVNSPSRAAIQSYLVDAERDISRQLSYYSRYSLLSKFAHAVHKSLDDADRESLETAYGAIKNTFQGVPKYSEFFDNFHEVMEGSVKGFVHDLKVDFSAYDPNNFARSMRVVAYEGESARSFEEFGTGEQQILLMAFAKAYVQTFSSGSLVLIIEEPEAHLHPLAQRWLKEYIYDMCGDGLQVILSTHSPDFLDVSNLDGLVRVRKDDAGITSVVQVTKKQLVSLCLETGVPQDRISEDNVLDFFGTKLFPDESKGFFATKVLLVEGATEYYALPELMGKLGHSLTQVGTEIVIATGTNAMPLYWRIFSAFEIQCACLFDGDSKNRKESERDNAQLSSVLKVNIQKIADGLQQELYISDGFAFFRTDFEHFMRSSISSYASREQEVRDVYHITSKPGVARAVCRKIDASELPEEIDQLWQDVIAPTPTTTEINDETSLSQNDQDDWYSQDIPF